LTVYICGDLKKAGFSRLFSLLMEVAKISSNFEKETKAHSLSRYDFSYST
jgi:hypothetical protein